MVYCGKPSMGCTTCRERRIKCDETKPICKQCIKSRRHCSGYRSDFDILHRDETQATETRAKRAAAKKAAKRAADGGGGGGGVFIQFEAVPRQKPSSSSSSSSSKEALPITWDSSSETSSMSSPSSTALTTTSPASANSSPFEVTFPVAPPSLPLDQHASHYFAAHFIMLPGNDSSKIGHLDYLIPMLRTETDPNSAFQLAYAACGLAAMSNREKAVTTDLVQLAYMQHARALQAVFRALSDPVLCKQDDTLAAVLLLSFFENITASKEAGLLAWRSHVEGAIHIVQQRGPEMLADKYSMRLFNAVRLRIIARTLSSGTAPSMGANWWTQESETCDPPGARFQRFSLEISEVRAEVTRLMAILPRHGHGMDHMLEMLRKTQDLDRNIANWLESLPEEYHPSVLFYEDNVEGDLKHAPVFPGRVDTYQGLVMVAVRNGVRASRIILGSLIIRIAAWICSPADYRLTPEYATAVATIKANIAGIVSSIPFSLSTYSNQRRHGLGPGSFVCGADEQSKMVGGLTAAWPLSTIRTCDFSTDEQREWAVGRLNFIAYDLGIRYASSLADTKIRFPSMLIRRDGLMTNHDPLKEIRTTLSTRNLPVR
ncbi:unnamed protein product [Discula destructiva]